MMLQRLKSYGLLVAVMVMMLISVIPASAQNPNGLDVDISSDGVAIYRVQDNGTRTLIIFIPAVINAGQGGGEVLTPTSADILTSGYVIVNTSALNVRSGPGAGYTILGTVAGGDHLSVIGKNDGRELWWFVDTGGIRGWVNNIHVIIRGTLVGAPVVENLGTLIAPTLYIGWTGNPIFPSVPHNGIPVCTLPGRSEFEIIGQSKQANFYEISAVCQDGTPVIGWVMKEIGIVRNPADLKIPVTQE